MDYVNKFFSLYSDTNTKTTFNNVRNGNVSNIRFNNLDFDVEGYEETRDLRRSLNSELSLLNKLATMRNYSDDNHLYKLASTEDLVEKIILPFSSLSENINIYKNVFIVISILMFGMIILINARRRINELAIKTSMGMKYYSVMNELVIENCIIVLIGSAIAIWVYNYTVVDIVSRMLEECINLQNSLYRITSKDIKGLNEAFSIFGDFSNVKVDYIYYVIVIGMVLLLTITLTIIVYIINQPKNVKEALMSS